MILDTNLFGLIQIGIAHVLEMMSMEGLTMEME